MLRGGETTPHSEKSATVNRARQISCSQDRDQVQRRIPREKSAIAPHLFFSRDLRRFVESEIAKCAATIKASGLSLDCWSDAGGSAKLDHHGRLSHPRLCPAQSKS
jgi:hypothetical protein